MLGDLIESALSRIGITQDRVMSWLGRDCGCQRRKEKLNSLTNLARRVVSGRIDKAREYLEEILSEE